MIVIVNILEYGYFKMEILDSFFFMRGLERFGICFIYNREFRVFFEEDFSVYIVIWGKEKNEFEVWREEGFWLGFGGFWDKNFFFVFYRYSVK